MSMFNPLRKILLPAVLPLLGGVAGITLGSCVITTGQKDCTTCGASFCNSVQVGTDCFCKSGYQFKEPNNPNDFECVRIPGKGGSSCPDQNSFLSGNQCFCDPGYNWCNPNDNGDLSCCLDDNQVLDDGTGGHTGHDTGDTGVDVDTGDTGGDACELNPSCPPPASEPDPADCNADHLGFVWCSNSVEMGAACSVYWECDGSQWVEAMENLHALCQFSGYDFAAGCVDDGQNAFEVCGFGPGTACEGDCGGCANDEFVEYCEDGALNQFSCIVLCNEVGVEGATFDHGVCLDDECHCCDFDEEGCGD
jgi:hypothetical protein